MTRGPRGWLLPSDLGRILVALGAIVVVTLALGPGLHIANTATLSVTYLLVVLLVAATSRVAVAVVTSVAAMLSLNFFFLPPVGTFTIADPHNWVALFAFLVVSLVASRLSAVARDRTDEAIGRRNELARLFDLSRDVLMVTDSGDPLNGLTRVIARRFDLEFVALAVPAGAEWKVHQAGARSLTLDRRELAAAFDAARTTLEFDAQARTDAGQRTMTVEDVIVRLVPLRLGPTPIGLLGAAGRQVEPGTLDTLAGLVAIAIERAHFLEERRAGELTRQSEQLKTALLASLSHDLRTPLTAIRIAAANLKLSELEGADRAEQADVILAEVERLTRLFENVLEMARIDAGAVTTESRWTHPSEIVAAARAQVEQTLHHHRVEVTIDPDVPARLDPRLTATALAHLLENAARYSPEGTTVEVAAQASSDGLTMQIRDHGPGIADADLPHVFERFYRGDASKARTSGTGMGLWIVRRLLAAEHGQVWAENAAGGGARFTIAVPAAAPSIETGAAST